MPGSSPTTRDQVALPRAVAPDHRRVVERVRDRGGRRDALAQRGRGRRGERGQRRAPSRSASSAPRPESPPEQVRIARPRPRGRAPRTASALASSSSSWGSAAHAAPASSTSARNTRWSPATAPVCAAAAAAPTADAPTFSTATADAGVRARRERVAQARAVAGVLDQQRDRAHLRLGGEVLEVVRRRQHRLVPARDRRVQPQPAPGRERVDREVAALRHERDVARLLRHERVAPQRRARVERDQAVAVGAADGERVAKRARARSSVAPRARGRPAPSRKPAA